MDRNPRIPSGGPPPRRAWYRSRTGVASLTILASLAAGCSQPGPFLRRQTMMGALKTNVAQLESEKDQLTKELADQRAELRRTESQLAELEAQNGDLAVRLDDARAVMGRQGIDDGKAFAPARSASDSDADRPSNRRATPARSQPKGRRTPFAQIPNERRSLDEPEEPLLDRDRDERPTRRYRDDSDDQSRLDNSSPWLPVARGATSPSRR